MKQGSHILTRVVLALMLLALPAHADETISALPSSEKVSEWGDKAEKGEGILSTSDNAKSTWGGAAPAGIMKEPPLADPCKLIPILPAPLTGTHGPVDPCAVKQYIEAELQAGDLDPTGIRPRSVGGKKVTDYLEYWWTSIALPAMKDMSAQIAATRIEQSRLQGMTIDAQAISQAVTLKQKQVNETRKDVTPSPLSCVPGTASDALARGSQSAAVLAKTFKKDFAKKAAGGPAMNTAAALKNRWKDYCDVFRNPDSNSGKDGCPANRELSGRMDGDIDVESLLFQDTIDLTNPDEYKAAHGLMRNLVQPSTRPGVSARAANTSAGREWILKLQHLEAAKNLAYNTVAEIIGRRTNFPFRGGQSGSGTCSNLEGAPESIKKACSKLHDNTTYFEKKPDGTKGTSLCLYFVGQMDGSVPGGDRAKNSWLIKGKSRQIPGSSLEGIQWGDFVYWTGGEYGHVGLYMGKGKVISADGSGVEIKNQNAWGTPVGYIRGKESAEVAQRPKKKDSGVTAIRVKAGINPMLISENPSYNETMLAMTKERFFDPEYYIRIHDNPGAIAQEQTSVNNYITLQLRDIYRMQEQINALLAARAALKFNNSQTPEP